VIAIEQRAHTEAHPERVHDAIVLGRIKAEPRRAAGVAAEVRPALTLPARAGVGILRSG
jgi:hypothetical protein